MKLYLVRHGETIWNAEGRIQGHLDVELNDKGKAQAKLAAKRLEQEPIDVAYTSDLSRAWLTAELIAKIRDIPIIHTQLLREAFLGEWQGHTTADLEQRFPKEFARYRQDSVTHRPPGAERIEEIIARSKHFLEDTFAKHADENVLAVGHGGSVRGVICAAFGLSPEFYRCMRLDNTSISIIDYREARKTLICLNDICHLRDMGKEGFQEF